MFMEAGRKKGPKIRVKGLHRGDIHTRNELIRSCVPLERRLELMVTTTTQQRRVLLATICLLPLAVGTARAEVGRLDEGSLVAWGYNGYGQCDVPGGLLHPDRNGEGITAWR